MTNNSEFIKGMKDATIELINLEVKRMKATTVYVEAKATELAPVDIGFLKASMVSDVRRMPHEIVGRVGNSASYAPYVHQGTGIYAEGGRGRKTPWMYYVPYGEHKGWYKTKGQKANPFLKNAIDNNLSSIKKLLGVK